MAEAKWFTGAFDSSQLFMCLSCSIHLPSLSQAFSGDGRRAWDAGQNARVQDSRTDGAQVASPARSRPGEVLRDFDSPLVSLSVFFLEEERRGKGEEGGERKS